MLAEAFEYPIAPRLSNGQRSRRRLGNCFAFLTASARLALVWRPSFSCCGVRADGSVREKRDRDQPAHEVRAAVAAIAQDRLAVGPRSRLAFQPYLTDAAPHPVAFIVRRLAKGPHSTEAISSSNSTSKRERKSITAAEK